MRLLKSWRMLVADTGAVTALEYALIGSLIAIAIIGAVSALGGGIENTFNTIANNL